MLVWSNIMSRNRPTNIDEKRLQVLETLSEKLHNLDEDIHELKSDYKKLIEGIGEIRNTLAVMQGADLNKRIEENKDMIEKLDDRVNKRLDLMYEERKELEEKRIKPLEIFVSNLTGKLVILGFLVAVIASILTGVAVKYLIH